MNQKILAEKIRCVGRRISKPRLIHQTGAHRAMEIFVEGKTCHCRRSKGMESHTLEIV